MRRTLLVLSLLAVSTVALVAPAHAVPPRTMDLSSWEPEFEGTALVGGIQTVSVTNYRDEALTGVSFPMNDTPCDCVAAAVSASHGELGSSAWTIGSLLPGETATLGIRYELVNSAVIPVLPLQPSTLALWITLASAGIGLWLFRSRSGAGLAAAAAG